MSKVAQALTIAGSDSGGGARVQADLKMFQMHRMSFGTSVAAQNTLNVVDIYAVSLKTIQCQLKTIVTDFDIRTFKIGMPVGLVETSVMIAKSISVKQAIKTAKDYIMAATSQPVNIGHESTNHDKD
ncbi:Hydroxymethylpyrimidine/phosphomethylpyrimidine kinase [Aggregatibacter actinomycetemcomitans]|uniref:bifunctional hydroxymethylpyrimidine kinase/phosphomethylpyrimidine kinase n=1 Tax=Aggregatibacter actinomycetemcomitans TaxID=714 RepID=UPI0001B9F104|nr:bifunctional hydroxymethylpyrimidine kinase/phosphomethylpyrimidine kinase [Aggregatibacter actinomycetemcomitans]ACX82539.1 phosphomethylpyrimidine kinase [Aggregatibacter actinomycetemcomitans D11S-1]KOE57756.1 phosphomethylpyrimidine kinase [Aggregatibacter actinomycetemcomitans serotype c str. AAS4A]KOE58502.1 phosphomethylpyrimidine kinase [Aggregatibacter actinomycetemcomitans serotype c str. SCC2302]KOE62421.1 phosphomethylpyrimidine kinase [Aggregatibacter actinomycetemcomitans serot